VKLALTGRFGENEIVPGPERFSRELFNILNKNNPPVVLIEYFFKGYSDYSLYKKYFGKKTLNNSLQRVGILPLIFRLIKERFDVIHLVNSQRYQLIILLLKTLLKYKIISTLHGFTEYELKNRKNYLKERHFIDLWVEKSIIKKSDLIVFPSNLLADAFRSKYSAYQHKFTVIPNGIGQEFTSVTNFPDFNDKFSILFYNSFDHSINKGLQELVDHLSLVKNIKIKLFVLGYEDKVNNKNPDLEIIFKDLLNRESFISFCKDTNYIIKSGAFEPFSIIIAECMTLGLIPIITENVGIKDFIKHGINGFLYDYRSSESLADLLKNISERKYNLREISDNSKKIACQLSWDNVAEKYLNAYKSLYD
jgi:glycosyltransferase involved in cell wall biosynthesis